MAFWTALDKEPKRQYRFIISGDGLVNEGGKENDGIWWYALSVTKPSLTINSTEHQLINHTFKFPTTGVWNDISISIIDYDTVGKSLYDSLAGIGFYPPDIDFKGKTDGISKALNATRAGDVEIQQLDAAGDIIETWTLKGAFITSINFGELSYDSENFVKIDLTIKYDWAVLNTTPGTVESSPEPITETNTISLT